MPVPFRYVNATDPEDVRVERYPDDEFLHPPNNAKLYVEGVEYRCVGRVEEVTEEAKPCS